MKITAQKLIKILNTQPQDKNFACLAAELSKKRQDTIVDIDQIYASTFQLLVYCAHQNYYTTTKLLLKNGANPNGASNISAIHCAATHDNIDMINLLEYYGADLNRHDPDGHTALALAIIYKKNQALSCLMLKENVDVNAAANYITTPLMLAYNNKDMRLMYWLIIKGANFAEFKESLATQKAYDNSLYWSDVQESDSPPSQEVNLSGGTRGIADTTEPFVISNILC